jgi:hypothetical protein
VSESRKKLGVFLVAVAIWAVVTPSMWRDLNRRSASQVRGPKWLWWIASSNLIGSVAYWTFGRRKTD